MDIKGALEAKSYPPILRMNDGTTVTAELDRAADPRAELLTTAHASAAWELLGHNGLVTDGKLPSPGAYLGDGDILYHYRGGKHYLSRDDWQAYIKFLDSKFK